MDRISRAGIVASAAFVLALVSGAAGAVAIPQGPDNINLHASDGIDFVSRASRWEFQNSADRVAARAPFNVGGKGMGFTGNLLRNIGRQQLLGAATGAARLLGGWGGLAAVLTQIVWDSVKQQWIIPGVPGDGETQSLMPSGTYLPPPYMLQKGSGLESGLEVCQGGSWQGAEDAITWTFAVLGSGAPSGDWVRWSGCGPTSNPPDQAIYLLRVKVSSPRGCTSTRAVLVLADAKCKDGGSGRPATDAEFRDALDNGLNAQPAVAAPMADFMHQNGVPIDTEAPYTEGPQHVNGPTTTSTQTGDAGTVTTTTQDGMDVTYSGVDVSVIDTQTKTVTDEAGNTTTTTETHTATGGDPVPPKDDKPPAVDVCIDHPDASGCAPLGDVGDAPDLPTQDVPVTFGYSSVTAACPAPETFTVFGRTYSLDWAPACTYATALRPVVIALALLSALLFVVKVGRG